jgi:TolA-binding protein
MDNRIKNINRKPAGNGFESDMVSDSTDNALFETISDYMKGWADLEEVKNDPALPGTKETVKNMISDYNKNLSENRDNVKFIRETFAVSENSKKLNDEIKFIKQEIDDKNLNKITVEWVKEWHERKQKIGVRDQKTEEISNFIKGAINSPVSVPEKIVADETIKVYRTSLFARYTTLAAAALIGGFILIRTLLPSNDPEKLFSSYYKPFEAVSPVTRSINNVESDLYSSAIGSFKAGDYQRAAAGFGAVLQKDSKSTSSEFFMGLSQLALENYFQAINLLSIASNDTGEYAKEAKWYLGLAYLKTDNKQKATECFEFLAGSEGFYRERSEKILRRLK